MQPFRSLKIIVTTSCLALALLTACGQRGPLFLPDKSATPAPAPVQKPKVVEDQQPAEGDDDTRQ